jgi:hypothetical protein
MRSSLAAFALPLCATCLLLEAPRTQKAAPDHFGPSRNARADGRFGMLLRQFKADEAAMPEHHEAGFKERTQIYQGERNVPEGFWVWQRPYWFVFRDGPDRPPAQRQWGPDAACGPPDTPLPGDHGSAWAAKEQDDRGEWLLLEYEQPVRATALLVHESFNPGALAAVAILTPQGELLELWRNREVKAVADQARVLTIDLPLGFDVERVMLSLQSESVPGSNQIDAVGLRDDKGRVHWASRAEASSTFADVAPQVAGGGAFRALMLRNALNQGQFQVQVQGLQQGLQLQVLNNALQVQRKAQNLQLQFPVPGADGKALELQRALKAADVLRLKAAAQPQRVLFRPADAEKAQAQQRIAELEKRVKELEEELARAKARK